MEVVRILGHVPDVVCPETGRGGGGRGRSRGGLGDGCSLENSIYSLLAKLPGAGTEQAGGTIDLVYDPAACLIQQRPENG